ncbi:MAG: addiction module antidote protein [Paracoccaceae bacterium]
MTLKTKPFDPAEFLPEETDQAELVADAFESGDPQYIKLALSTVARAKSMSETAKAAGISRQALYKALSENGDPKLSTLTKITKAVGINISITKDEELAQPIGSPSKRKKQPRSISRKA